MTTYETSAMVQAEGEVRVVGVPLAPGTEVEVTISPKERATSSKQPAYDELEEVYRQCRDGNWDAHGAEAVEAETLRNARRFIEALPPGYPLPSAGAEPDGQITLEWYRVTNWLLTVSVSREGMLYYAALLGEEDPRGTCRFEGEVPETILYWIRRVSSP